MIYLLYGEDDFSLREFLVELRSQIGPAEVIDANSATLNASEISPQQLLETCSGVPFLAERRLIVVEGLFQRFESQGGRPRQGRSRNTRSQSGDKWDNLADVLSQIPETTLLAFVDGPLRRDNPLLRRVASLLETREFPRPSGQALDRWIRQRVVATGSTISEGAVRMLMDYVGGDLWVLSGEIEKLTLYCGSGEISDDAVRLLVGHTRVASVFNAVDAVLEGKGSTALGLVSRMLQSGAEVSYILVMLARQLRLVLLTQELLAHRVPKAELGRRLGLSADFAVRRVEEQAHRHSPDKVRAMYRKLLDTDLAIKRGAAAEEQALETLVAELCGSATPSPPYPNRTASR